MKYPKPLKTPMIIRSGNYLWFISTIQKEVKK